MDIGAVAFFGAAGAGLAAFGYIWWRLALGGDETSAGGIILGWMPAAIVASIASVMAYFILMTGLWMATTPTLWD